VSVVDTNGYKGRIEHQLFAQNVIAHTGTFQKLRGYNE